MVSVRHSSSLSLTYAVNASSALWMRAFVMCVPLLGTVGAYHVFFWALVGMVTFDFVTPETAFQVYISLSL